MRPPSPETEDGFWLCLKRSGLTSTDLWMHLPPLPQNGGAVVERTKKLRCIPPLGAPMPLGCRETLPHLPGTQATSGRWDVSFNALLGVSCMAAFPAAYETE